MIGFQTPIDETPLVVIDTETTGLRAGRDRVIEIGAIRLIGDSVEERYETLIDPRIPIPAKITRLTGISTDMVQGAPVAARVLPLLEDFLDEAVVVGHNVKFDVGFLAAEFRMAGMQYPDNPSICTARLARRILRALPSRSLAGLKRHYGIRARAHRAMDDAQATAHVFRKLVQSIRAERDLRTIGDLIRLQYLPYRSTLKEPDFIERLRASLRERLPEAPGVYFHRNAAGELLYIGKARNLKNRVLSYFTAYAAHPPHIRRLVREVREVTWEVTDSELSALLLESRLIKELHPKLNRAQTTYRNKPYIRIAPHEKTRKARLTYELRTDGAEYYGPLAGHRQAEGLLSLASALYGLEAEMEPDAGEAAIDPPHSPPAKPAVGEVPNHQIGAIGHLRRFLTGEHEEAGIRIEERMKEAAGQLRFEEAAWWKRKLSLLESIEPRQSCIAAPVHDLTCVLIQPSSDRTRAELYVLVRGHLAEEASIQTTLDEKTRRTIGTLVERNFPGASAVETSYDKRALDRVRIITEWLVTHARECVRVDWDPEKSSIVDFTRCLITAVADIAAPRNRE